jgi:hypothetical protein
MYSRHLALDRRIILKRIKEMGGGVECGLVSCDSGQGPLAGHCEHGNQPRVPYKEGNFLTS